MESDVIEMNDPHIPPFSINDLGKNQKDLKTKKKKVVMLAIHVPIRLILPLT